MNYLKSKYLYNIEMLYYDRMDISEGYLWYLLLLVYFLNKGFKFQSHVCNRCYDLPMTSMNRSDIYILNIKNDDYRCITTRISKSEAIKLLKNIDLIEKSGTL